MPTWRAGACAQVLANPAAFDVAVTTYDMMHSADLGRALCRTIHWRYLVLDEGHKIKNEHTLVSQSMRHTRRVRMRPPHSLLISALDTGSCAAPMSGLQAPAASLLSSFSAALPLT
jgi:hypothetical protein